jgi:hypothetical protein
MNSGGSLENYLFGPLSKQYCMLFYLMSVLGLLTFVIVLVTAGYGILSGSKKFSLTEILIIAYSLFFPFLFYIQNRLLHSMCINTA